MTPAELIALMVGVVGVVKAGLSHSEDYCFSEHLHTEEYCFFEEHEAVHSVVVELGGRSHDCHSLVGEVREVKVAHCLFSRDQLGNMGVDYS
jgi:hypothetical protein